MVRVFSLALLFMAAGCAWQWCWKCSDRVDQQAPFSAEDVPLAPSLKYGEDKKPGQRKKDKDTAGDGAAYEHQQRELGE